MTRPARSLLVAVLHVALVSTLGAKLLWDRATRPRLWVEAAPWDPELPFRGRYVRLRAVGGDALGPADLAPEGDGWRIADRPHPPAPPEIVDVPVAFFIPEHVPDPSSRPAAGEQLWMEVTLPKTGPPRPIRLGIRRDDRLTPLPLD